RSSDRRRRRLHDRQVDARSYLIGLLRRRRGCRGGLDREPGGGAGRPRCPLALSSVARWSRLERSPMSALLGKFAARYAAGQVQELVFSCRFSIVSLGPPETRLRDLN